jgi:SNF2 family DNA or RNA helicase
MPEALYKLRPFQQEMVDKFMAVYDKYPNTLCGDDMGTGKTFEGMELDKRKRERDGRTGLKTLVLTTLGGTDVWTRHFRKFQPWIKTVTIDPKARGSFANSIYLEEADVYICHWDVIRMDEVKQALYYNHWFHIIGDELHRTKNRKAQVTQAFKRITCDHKTGLTGTPGDNNPQDLWSLLNWLYPKVWGSYWRFFDMYVDYKKHPVQGYKIIIGVRNEDHLLRVIEPYYIRRRFEEVVGDVPEKYYTPLYVDLTPRQRKAYNQMRDKDLAWVGENEDQPVPAPVVVTRLQRLQQFALAHVEVIETLKKRRNKWYDPKRKRIEWHADLGPPSARRVSDPRMNFPFWWEPVTVYKLIDPSAKLDQGHGSRVPPAGRVHTVPQRDSATE